MVVRFNQTKMATSIVPMEMIRKYNEKYAQLRMARRTIQIIDMVQPEKVDTKRCQARTLEGKPCPFASIKCSKFCGRHKPPPPVK